jgi:hypothetical protein
MRAFQLLHLVVLLSAFVAAAGCVTSTMTKQAWDDWYARHAPAVEWVGYQGSDAYAHHFIARIKGGDVKLIVIRRSELVVADERPWSSYWTGPLYYYLFDPVQNYRRIEADG